MKKMKLSARTTVAFVAILIGIALALPTVVKAQYVEPTVSSVSQFQSELNSSVWSEMYGNNSDINFAENGNSIMSGNSLINAAATPTSVWNMVVTINSGNVDFSASTSFHSPGLNWSYDSIVNAFTSTETIDLAAAYNAATGVGMSISDIVVNGAPVAGSITANQSNPFAELTVNNGSIPITQLSYVLTDYDPDAPNGQYNTPSGDPTVSSYTMIPSVSSVPEPTSLAMSMVAGIAVFAIKKIKGKL